MYLLDAREAFLLSCEAEAKAPKTLRSYQDITNDFVVNIGNLDLLDLSTDHVRNYMASLYERTGKSGNKLSAQTAMKHYQVVRTWLRWCHAQGFVRNCIMDMLKPPKISNDLPDALSGDEIEKLFRNLQDRPFRDIVIIQFFLYTGCLVSEVANMEIDHVNLEQGYVAIHGKSGKDEMVPLPNEFRGGLYNYIHHHRKAMPGEKGLFVGKSGHALGLEGLSMLVRRILREVRGRGKIGPQTLRHTFASEFAAQNGNLETLRRILRQTDIRSTQRYAQ